MVAAKELERLRSFSPKGADAFVTTLRGPLRGHATYLRAQGHLPRIISQFFPG